MVAKTRQPDPTDESEGYKPFSGSIIETGRVTRSPTIEPHEAEYMED